MADNQQEVTQPQKRAKHIFVTGGVVSSLGKGIAAASIGCLLENRGLRVTLQKFDPYLNVDPGTMSPFQHGEVFVTDDGAHQAPPPRHQAEHSKRPDGCRKAVKGRLAT